jgi:hypothetical protein
MVPSILKQFMMRGSLRERIRVKRLAGKYRIGDHWKRIYFYHVRKAAGTSINYAFLSLGGETGRDVYEKMPSLHNHRILSGNKIFLGWNRSLIERGDYFYAFSHIPAHELRLPDRTFSFTCIRDPAQRVLSHYKMLLEYRESPAPPAWFEKEGDWLGEGFRDFLSKIPQEHLLNQLYMFSSTLNPDEAFNRITHCSHCFLVEGFSRGITELSEKIGIELNPMHVRKTLTDPHISSEEVERLHSILEPEYILYDNLKKYLSTSDIARFRQNG